MIQSFAPGRVELLGNHTDYNQGLVLALALERGVTLKGTVRDDRKLIFRALTFDKTYKGSLDSLNPAHIHKWANYILGVIAEFVRLGYEGSGLEIELSSTLPIGAGLSSSAAVECATARFLQQAWNTQLSDLELARIGQRAEHRFVGVRCGLLDQITSLFGRPGKAVFIDCRSFEVELLPLPSETSFVIAQSGASHALADGQYNERRFACESAAKSLGIESLREASTAMVENASVLTDVERRRALHITGENERVLEAKEKFRQNDAEGFGRLMIASHQSSQINFENSCPELDALVEEALKVPGCLGARLSGGGFGGATINLVRKESLDSFKGSLKQTFSSMPELIEGY